MESNAIVDTSRSSDGFQTYVSHYDTGRYGVSLGRPPYDGCTVVAKQTRNISAVMTYVVFPNPGNENGINVTLWKGWDIFGNPNYLDGGFTLVVYCP